MAVPAVNTGMVPRGLGDGQTDGIIELEQLARTVVEALRAERFYVLSHPEVEEYVRRKGDDVDRWLLGMRWNAQGPSCRYPRHRVKIVAEGKPDVQSFCPLAA